MYLRNCWYVAAWSRELAAGPVARTILEEAVVVYRMASGEVAALEDRCPHRQLPLSMGAVVGDNIQCGYHGMASARKAFASAYQASRLSRPERG